MIAGISGGGGGPAWLIYHLEHRNYLRDTITILERVLSEGKRVGALKKVQAVFLRLFLEYCLLLGSAPLLAYLRNVLDDDGGFNAARIQGAVESLFLPAGAETDGATSILLDYAKPSEMTNCPSEELQPPTAPLHSITSDRSRPSSRV